MKFIYFILIFFNVSCLESHKSNRISAENKIQEEEIDSFILLDTAIGATQYGMYFNEDSLLTFIVKEPDTSLTLTVSFPLSFAYLDSAKGILVYPGCTPTSFVRLSDSVFFFSIEDNFKYRPWVWGIRENKNKDLSVISCSCPGDYSHFNPSRSPISGERLWVMIDTVEKVILNHSFQYELLDSMHAPSRRSCTLQSISDTCLKNTFSYIMYENEEKSLFGRVLGPWEIDSPENSCKFYLEIRKKWLQTRR